MRVLASLLIGMLCSAVLTAVLVFPVPSVSSSGTKGFAFTAGVDG